jgi:hypothetical protein
MRLGYSATRKGEHKRTCKTIAHSWKAIEDMRKIPRCFQFISKDLEDGRKERWDEIIQQQDRGQKE